ncbi:MAG: DUF922 domain-containing protein [Candidatus Thiodiazotropha sp.]
MYRHPSPAQTNRPGPAAPSEYTPHAGFASAQPEGADVPPAQPGPALVGWPRTIAWSEFRDINKRPKGETENAQISVGLRHGKVKTVEEHGEYKLGEMEFKIIVKKAESWVVKSEKTEQLLVHEQGHYDIAGLCYRDFLAAVRALQEDSRNELLRQVNGLMAEHGQRAVSLSDEYDVDTEHGLNQTQQQSWLNQIAASRESGTPLTAPAI